MDLGRVDARVAEQCAHLLEIVMLLEHLHRHAVPQVVRLQFGIADRSTTCRADDVWAKDSRGVSAEVVSFLASPSPRHTSAIADSTAAAPRI